jgi:CPA1 family monovalent cation:H+ antiporter
MNVVEIFLIFLTAITISSVISTKIGIPAPVMFIVTGFCLSFFPDLAAFKIEPELMLLIFLPLLLMEASFMTSFRDFRANLRPILQLAVGLVVATTVVTAWVFQAIVPGANWVTGLVLGAIISPPDAVAATAITKHVKLPKRLEVILEGESLVNDAIGLVLYRFAVAAVVMGAFSFTEFSMHLAWITLSGVIIGPLMAWLFIKTFKYINDTSVQILGTLILPFAIFIVAEALHSSSILAVVTGGLLMGWAAPLKFKSTFRLSAIPVWKMVVFVLNGLVFLLIGLYAPGLMTGLSFYSPWQLALWLAAVSAAVILTRLIWVYALSYGTRFLFSSIRKRDPYPSWQNVFITAWTGMRGVISLALALAIPFTLADGQAFPHRDLIIFLSVGVILVTLILQGLTLPFIIRKLTVTYDWSVLHEDWHARRHSVERALERIEGLKNDSSIPPAALERITSHYSERFEALGNGPNTPLSPKDPPSSFNHPLLEAENKLWQELLEIEHQAVVELRKKFEVGDDVMHNVVRDIDMMRNRFSVN